MIEAVALVMSALSLAGVAYLLWRDAKRFVPAERGDARLPKLTGISKRIEAIVKRHQYDKSPGHRTSVAYVKDLMGRAEREAAKLKLIK